MSFAKNVQVGRVVTVNYGTEVGKLAVIVEIIDQGRALIDGPTTGVPRQALSFRRMALTKLVLESLPRGATTKIVKKHIEKDGTVAKFGETTLAKKVAARKARDSMTDFDRFSAKLARQSRRAIVAPEFKKLRKSAK